jgi:hypothetical protein
MIVTTGKIIVVESGYKESFRFERDSRTPGLVRVEKTRPHQDEPKNFTLPGNKSDARSFTEGYMRCVHENLGFTRNDHESHAYQSSKELEAAMVELRKRPKEEQLKLIEYALEAWPLVGTPTP